MTPLALIKLIGGPGSLRFLAVGTLFGILLGRASPPYRRFTRTWLITLYLLYFFLALPIVARSIAGPFDDPLAGQRPPAAPIDALIIFDGDNPSGRIAETRRIWTLIHPSVVIVSGDEWLVDQLRAAGIPQRQLLLDDTSANTRQQVGYVQQYVSSHATAAVAVVVSRLQMPRVAALVQQARIPVALYAAPIDGEPAHAGWRSWLPSYSALRMSRDALYERVALSYYRWRGWIATQEPDAPASSR